MTCVIGGLGIAIKSSFDGMNSSASMRAKKTRLPIAIRQDVDAERKRVAGNAEELQDIPVRVVRRGARRVDDDSVVSVSTKRVFTFWAEPVLVCSIVVALV